MSRKPLVANRGSEEVVKTPLAADDSPKPVLKLAVHPQAAAESLATELSGQEEGFRIRWSGLSLTFDEKTLNAITARLVDRIPDLKDLKIEVSDGELAARLVVHRFGVPLSAKATMTQLRLKDGFLAFVLEKVQALSFIPIPDQLLTYLAQKAPRGLLTYYPEDQIMVVNLNDWMPPGMDLSLERTLFEKGALTLQFASGSYDISGFLEPPPIGEE